MRFAQAALADILVGFERSAGLGDAGSFEGPVTFPGASFREHLYFEAVRTLFKNMIRDRHLSQRLSENRVKGLTSRGSERRRKRPDLFETDLLFGFSLVAHIDLEVATDEVAATEEGVVDADLDGVPVCWDVLNDCVRVHPADRSELQDLLLED